MAKLVFLQRDTYECIGPMYISAVIKKSGHSCDVFIENEDRDLIKAIKDSKPDVIGFSTMTGLHNWALSTAKKVKDKYEVPVIFGGPHPTFYPDLINQPQVDIVCRGEGEYAMLDLMNSIQEREDYTTVKNLWTKKESHIIKNELRHYIEPLDILPFPDRSIYDKYKVLKESPQREFFTSRGCPFKCSFCLNDVANTLYKGKGKIVRRFGVDRVIDELVMLRDTYDTKYFVMGDDTFVINKEWVYEFAKKYKERVAIPFTCGIRVDIVDEELIKMLKYADCRIVSFGIESGNDDIRNNILNKGISKKQIIETSQLLKKHGIKLFTFNMVNNPGEDLEKALETVDLNVKIQADYPWCSLVQPYEGSRIRKYAYDIGAIYEGTMSQHLFHTTEIIQKDTPLMINLQKVFYVCVRFPFLIPVLKKLLGLPLSKFFHVILLFSSFHRYITMYWHLEGPSIIIRTIKLGLKRIKGYI